MFDAIDFILCESANQFRVLFTTKTFRSFDEAIAYANENLASLQAKGRAALEIV